METVMLDPRCWRIARIVGRNPLLRRTDRIEALVTVIAFAVSVLAIPLAGVAAGVTYGVRNQVYVQEAHERHAVMATVTGATADGSGITVVQAKWPALHGERRGSVEVAHAAKVGDHTTIWVDKGGDPVAPPTSTWQAVGDAFVTALAILLLIGIAVASLAISVRSRLDRARDAQWDHELNCLQEDGGRAIP
ncbi:Rv1733c family protein [Mycobacterium stomatepiae]|uniref:Membrane protein n=1 Tax=Mycobacterium stomatepiae TaxID=470076 RepID=A0A7I7Q1K6_9MYCO|nr:hypothetical protein [Mycobacterium stomatepiae]MCV7166691.1 hypothetical protein [Mycobacterium stomatepiae]BBY20244.1 membrane protein [Mycobacterium stomatepiae]